MKKYTENIEQLHENEAKKINEYESTEIRVRLDEAAFTTLVSGEIYTSDSNAKNVKIILADIGYDKMIQIINSLK
jgi:hypothetical protein